MKRFMPYIISIVLIVCGVVYSNSLAFESEIEFETLVKGEVLNIEEINPSYEQMNNMLVYRQWQVKVKILEGAFKGRILDTIHYSDDNPAYDFMVYQGDNVVLSLETEDGVLKEAYISSLSREKYLSYLLLIFVFSVLLIGAKKGIKTIVSLIVTGWAILKILLPAILLGKDPVIITIIVCGGITIITLMLITGFTRKSLSAISGTMIGIVISGLIARYIVILTRISGLGSEESRMFFFSYAEGRLDMVGILFAGIVIGALGAVMDVAMSIASSISEVHQANPKLDFMALTKSGLNIGRDIIGTMSNTLILAYTGGALSLMLLLRANNIPFLKYINLDIIVAEIIRALAGSIGLFLAVPFTAAIAAALYVNRAS